MYITGQDIQERIGNDAYAVLLGDYGDKETDEGDRKLERALVDASGEIDGYVGQRYSVPLETVPAAIKRLAVDIAIYRLAQDSGWTEDRRKRYEDAVKLLQGIAKGDVSLGMPSLNDGNDDESDNDTIDISSQPRRFNRDNKVF